MSSDSFVPIIGSANLLQWALRVKPDYPRSANVYNALVIHGKEMIDAASFYSLSFDKDVNVILVRDKVNKTTVTVYCPAGCEEMTVGALWCTTLVDWTSKSVLCFHSLPKSLTDKIWDLITEKRFGSTIQSSFETLTYDTDDDKSTIELPEHIVLKQLSASSAKLAFSKFKYNSFYHYADFEKLCFTSGVCVALYPGERKAGDEVHLSALPRAGENEKVLAWAVCTPHGAVSIVGYSEPCYSSLLPLALYCCARMLPKAGLLVHHCNFDEDDKMSERLRSKGWLATPKTTWMWRF